MRKSLAGALLLLVAAFALGASVNYFGKPQAQLAASRITATGVPQKVDELPGPGRELVVPAEAKLAIARKLLPPGTKSLLTVSAQLQHGDYVWNEQGIKAGKLTIWVDLRRQMVSAFRNGHEVGTAVIVYGAKDMASPEGVFRILRKSRDYHSRTYDAPMPHSLFITNDGVALHGSPMSKRRASHGCIGLPGEFARKLFDASKVGDIVEITRSDVTLGK